MNPYDDPSLFYMLVYSVKFARTRIYFFKSLKELHTQDILNQADEYYIKSVNMIPPIPSKSEE